MDREKKDAAAIDIAFYGRTREDITILPTDAKRRVEEIDSFARSIMDRSSKRSPHENDVKMELAHIELSSPHTIARQLRHLQIEGDTSTSAYVVSLAREWQKRRAETPKGE